jgi:hypothetical protein
LASADFACKRALIELLIDRVIVTDGAVEIRYVLPTGPEGEREPFCRLRTDYLHRGPRREGRGWRQVAPLTAGAHEMEQAVQEPPHVGGARPPTRLGRWDQRFEQAELVVAQRLPGAAITHQGAACRCPHRDLQEWDAPS